MNVVGGAMAGEPSDLDAAAIARAGRLAGARPGGGVWGWLAGGRSLAAWASPWLAVPILAVVPVVVWQTRGSGAARALLERVGVHPDLVRISSPLPSQRGNRIFGTVMLMIAILSLVAEALIVSVAAPGTQVGGYVGGPGLTEKGRAGVVWYAPDGSRRDHLPAATVADQLAFPAFLLWLGLFFRRRGRSSTTERPPIETTRALLRASPSAAARPFLAAEVALEEAKAPDAETLARQSRPLDGDPFLEGWVLAHVQAHTGDLAAAKETLASTYEAISDGRRMMLATALSVVWAAAGDAAMSDAHRANARKLARRAGYRPPTITGAFELSDATLVTNHLDRVVSKNRA
jgi:hypothetical protein